jgi:hypothetical protein
MFRRMQHAKGKISPIVRITVVQKLHCFIPLSSSELEMKVYFFSGKTTRHPLVISEFITCQYETSG